MGFAMLSAGAVRKKNVQNIMLKVHLRAALKFSFRLFSYPFFTFFVT